MPKFRLRSFLVLVALLGIAIGLGLRWKRERDLRRGAAQAALEKLFARPTPGGGPPPPRPAP